MSSFPILDLVIGMIFIYFLLSIICSSAVELWLSIRRTRARLLEQWLKDIFNKQALDSHGLLSVDAQGSPISVGQSIMDHCMVTGLSKKGESTSYINAQNFISALLDKISIAPAAGADAPVQTPPATLEQYINAIQNSTVISGELKRTILAIANEANQAANVIKGIPVAANISTSITNNLKSELDHFRERLEKWYDSSADRLTGTLKRKKVLPRTIIIATVITVALNMDSVEISRYLYTNKEVSKQFAQDALGSIDSYRERVDNMKAKSNNDSTDPTSINQLNSNVDQLKQDVETLKSSIPASLPIGRDDRMENFLNHLFGWIATILAICVGAPFWFDILNKISNLRSTGPKPVSTAGDKS